MRRGPKLQIELTDNDKALINDLINIAWQAGSVKSPQMGQTLELLRAKLQQKQQLEKVE